MTKKRSAAGCGSALSIEPKFGYAKTSLVELVS